MSIELVFSLLDKIKSDQVEALKAENFNEEKLQKNTEFKENDQGLKTLKNRIWFPVY